jgi:hypothetical protein
MVNFWNHSRQNGLSREKSTVSLRTFWKSTLMLAQVQALQMAVRPDRVPTTERTQSDPRHYRPAERNQPTVCEADARYGHGQQLRRCVVLHDLHTKNEKLGKEFVQESIKETPRSRQRAKGWYKGKAKTVPRRSLNHQTCNSHTILKA